MTRKRATGRATQPTLRVEKDLLRRGGFTRLAALDEVGRGALAGPVSVGVVVIDTAARTAPSGLRDSKLLTPSQRAALVTPVQRWALDWAVGHASASDIDRLGIVGGLRLAGQLALSALREPVDVILLDGTLDYLSVPAHTALFSADGSSSDAAAVTGAGVVIDKKVSQIPVHTRVKADRDCSAVAAASVLAKTTRDALMIDYARIYPAYGWARNKGYGTEDHVRALRTHGPCDLHRVSWRLPRPADASTMVDDGMRESTGTDVKGA